MISRFLDLNKIKRSFFLFGPRQVGKTFLIKNALSPDIFINLLKQEEYLRYAGSPQLLRQEVKENMLVVIDEIQRCPSLLNEVQLIIDDNPTVQFILTGSSARKLRRNGVNLLGGRAIVLHLFPFTANELTNLFTIEDALLFGTLPSITLEKSRENKILLLKSYVETYLKEEIQQEALTRNVPAFARFLELAAHENGNILNFQALSREVGVTSKTIREYFQILEDTLLGFFIAPFTKSERKRVVSHPRFYFFDPGVVSALRNELSGGLTAGTPAYGRAFEHWIILETKRLLDYKGLDWKTSFFRTSDGAEVDLLLEKGDELWAIEIKSSAAPSASELRGLKSFLRDHQVTKALCVCQTPRPYTTDHIEFIPWKDFLKLLNP